MDRVTLAIPSRPEFVGVVRLAVTSLARGAGLDEDRVDDLKIAVSEACTNAMGASEGGPGISVDWSSSTDSAVVEIRGPSSATGTTGEDRRDSFSSDLLRSLVDTYEMDSDTDGPVTRLRVSLA